MTKGHKVQANFEGRKNFGRERPWFIETRSLQRAKQSFPRTFEDHPPGQFMTKRHFLPSAGPASGSVTRLCVLVERKIGSPHGELRLRRPPPSGILAGMASDDTPPRGPHWPSHPDIERHENRNLLLLVLHQIVFRIGWIFKTESVIMPAVLDQVAGAGWIRGMLPILNRFGQSLPPVFAASSLQRMHLKKRALAMLPILMSIPFLVLSGVWLGGGFHHTGQDRAVWPVVLFLALYFTFFVFIGLYHLAFGTVQGKLIRPTRRGHLLRMSTFWGSIPAILMAWWLLSRWLRLPDGGYGYTFAFAGVCFFVSGLIVFALFEPGDGFKGILERKRDTLTAVHGVLRDDPNLRRLVAVAMLFGTGLIIFPHYQALAREELGLSGVHLMVWVITQNAAVGILSLFVGPLADRKGNRLTLQTLLFGSAIAPAYAIALPNVPGGDRVFWLVFVPLAVIPLVLRLLVNYTLEICDAEKHARYLSTVSLGLAVPFFASPLVGWVADVAGFRVVFLSAVCLTVLGGILSLGLSEPRHAAVEEISEPVEMGVE